MMSRYPAVTACSAGVRPSSNGESRSTPLAISNSHPIAEAVIDGPAQLPGEHLGAGLGRSPSRSVHGPPSPGRGRTRTAAARWLSSGRNILLYNACPSLGRLRRSAAGGQAPSDWRMPGLPAGALLALAENPGQHRERGGQPAPQIAGVRVGARRRAAARALRRNRSAGSSAGCTREYVRYSSGAQRCGPVSRSRRLRIGGQMGRDRLRVGGAGGRRDARCNNLRVQRQHLSGPFPPLRAVHLAVDQAGQPAELVGRARRANRPADRAVGSRLRRRTTSSWSGSGGGDGDIADQGSAAGS